MNGHLLISKRRGTSCNVYFLLLYSLLLYTDFKFLPCVKLKREETGKKKKKKREREREADFNLPCIRIFNLCCFLATLNYCFYHLLPLRAHTGKG